MPESKKAPRPGAKPKKPTAGRRILDALDSLGDPAEVAKAVRAGKAPPGAGYRVTRPTPVDAELAALVAAWPALPDATRAAIRLLVNAAAKG